MDTGTSGRRGRESVDHFDSPPTVPYLDPNVRPERQILDVLSLSKCFMNILDET